MLHSEIHGDKTEMHVTFLFTRTTHVLLLLIAVASFAPAGLGQSKAIEPCPASANPIKTSADQTPAVVTRASTRVRETVIDASIPVDPATEKVLEPYTAKVRALNVVIGNLEGELKKGGVGASSLGNFVTDGMMAKAKARPGKPAVLAITNAGGLRKSTIAAGELRASDIFELLPFENALIEIDLTGAQVKKLLQNLTGARDAQSGARIEYRWNAENRPEFVNVKLVDASGHEQEIDPKGTYTIVTIDYLLKLASGNYAILQEGTNVTPLGVTIRDAILDYVKSETASGRPIRARLDERFVQIGPGPTKSETPQQ
jgi:2',3'-cyclic-nucleotide 2'-phosphodiesterase (5'-nucleotidase family)